TTSKTTKTSSKTTTMKVSTSSGTSASVGQLQNSRSSTTGGATRLATSSLKNKHTAGTYNLSSSPRLVSGSNTISSDPARANSNLATAGSSTTPKLVLSQTNSSSNTYPPRTST
ncbi:unnamed protein product, partial [Amoebophrya sp. A120]